MRAEDSRRCQKLSWEGLIALLRALATGTALGLTSICVYASELQPPFLLGIETSLVLLTTCFFLPRPDYYIMCLMKRLDDEVTNLATQHRKCQKARVKASRCGQRRSYKCATRTYASSPYSSSATRGGLMRPILATAIFAIGENNQQKRGQDILGILFLRT